MRGLIFILTVIVLVGGSQNAHVLGLTPEQKRVIDSGAYYFNVEATPLQDSCSLLVANVGNILTSAEITEIERNRPVYEAAAQQANIPWAMIATVHLKETRLSRSNPGNGQGIYQFVNANGGPYPAGPVTDAEFERQTLLAANFLRGKLAANLESNRELSASGGSPDTIKDTFFSYNGRARVYAEQAAALGFNPETQPFEGSPYVMNKADPQRDPTINTTTWGQIKRDFGGIEYPANDFYGAYVTYAAIAGEGTDNCNQDFRNRIVQIAREEMALGANEAEGTYLKYTGGVHAEWCAYFASWVLDKAGVPFEGGPIPAVTNIRAYARDRGWYYEKNDTSFTPQPGDLAIYKENLMPFPSHVNIVISYDAANNTITTIGGNETNTIREYTNSRTLPALSGFVRINP